MSNKPPLLLQQLLDQRLLNRSFAPFSTFLHRHRHHHHHFSVAPTPSATNSSLPFSVSSRRNAVSGPSADEDVKTVGRSREATGSCEGLRWALAGKGVLVKENVFRNLKPFELKQKGATIAESVSGLPVRVRGDVIRGGSQISKAQFLKLLKQVSTHISSISDVFVHDGAIGSSPECNVKVRVISDSPSAILPLSSFLWKAPTRAVSHDSCPVTVYVASSISPSAGEALGLQGKGHNGFITADADLSSLILCGKAFADANGTKDALAILSGPIIASRGGLPLSARLLVSGDSLILLFAPEDIVQSCSDLLVSTIAGVIFSSAGVSPLFQTGKFEGRHLFKLPAAVILASSDSSGVIPPVSKLSPGQAAYHFLAGYQNGKFIPVYGEGCCTFDPLELAKALLTKLQENQISAFLMNVREGEKQISGKLFVDLVQSSLKNSIPPFKPKGGDLRAKYKSFLSGKFQELPEDFSF